MNIYNNQSILPTADAFASYLLSNVGCMTDLSTDEVIMNSQVVAATESSHPRVHLMLAPEQPNSEAQLRVGDDSILYVTPAPPPTDKVVLIDLQLNTNDYDDLRDVQFVVDVMDGNADEADTGRGRVRLINGQCDDQRRVAARGNDRVTVQLSTEGAATVANTDSIRVWAGWATGHEAVRLTPEWEIRIASPSHGDDQETPSEAEDAKTDNNKVDKDDQEEPQASEKHKVRPSLNAYQHHHRDGEIKHKAPPDTNGEDKTRRENSKSDHRKDTANHGHEKDDDGGDDDESKNHRKQRKPKPRHDDHTQQHRKTLDDVQKTQKQDNQYGNNDKGNRKEPGIEIDTTWFLYGLGILIMGNLLVVQLLTQATRGRGGSTKGRLSL